MIKIKIPRFIALFVSISFLLDPSASLAEVKFGPQSKETFPNRRQEWLVPSQDLITPSRAVLFRPAGQGPFRLAIIAHASTQNRLQRAQMPQPEYSALAATLVARGFAVLVPQRPGHGKTGGPYLEDQNGCDNAEYTLSGQTTGDSILAALRYMREQPFVRKDATVVVGHSAGGWGALFLAERDPKSISAIIVFAPGRGGLANNRADTICASDKLLEAAGRLGERARVPVTWLVAENDSYFPPAFSERMADAFHSAGGKVDFRVLPPFGNEGHWLAESKEGGLLSSLIANASGLNLQSSTGQERSIAKRR
ncbi:alpha/beta hydrolase family protein [Bradyrhizobium sp. SYSU BS000235]|uniref:alpha/beta hydrolase family protein n=1 Tax=Bradyrhizobium sp. SYSU BS000235 TaxID=3411332 RepID=UPI003C736AB3